MKIQGNIWKYMNIQENICLMIQKTETRTNKGTKRGENEAGNKTEDGENKH